jgi:hypothetical protein
MSLQCSKVSVLLFQKDRQWLVQMAHAVLSSLQTVHVMHVQIDGVNAYEGYKHNGIAQAAISSRETIVVPNVSSHVGYDSRLDALAGIQGRNCLATPIITMDAKSNARCVGVLFATNKLSGGFSGDACFDVSYVRAETYLQDLTLFSLPHLQMQQPVHWQVHGWAGVCRYIVTVS